MLKKKVIFFQCGIENSLVYIFHVHNKKNYIFSMWDLKLISRYTLCSKKKVMFF